MTVDNEKAYLFFIFLPEYTALNKSPAILKGKIKFIKFPNAKA